VTHCTQSHSRYIPASTCAWSVAEPTFALGSAGPADRDVRSAFTRFHPWSACLPDTMMSLPSQPSGGQMQRVRVLRAALLLALAIGGSDISTSVASEQSEQLARNALALDGRRARGEQLFNSQCASCHGPTASGDAAQLVPSLAGQRRAYLIKQLADFAEGERVTTQMHAVVVRSEIADPQAWADVALYLNSLPPLMGRNTAVARLLSMGKESYHQRCASCHEDDARGDDDGFVPALRNQHYEYLLRELRAMGAGHRFDMTPEIRRSLLALKGEELTAIAHYLSRLRGPVRDRARLRDDGTVSD
jgi:cytochrome c553